MTCAPIAEATGAHDVVMMGVFRGPADEAGARRRFASRLYAYFATTSTLMLAVTSARSRSGTS